MGKIATEQYAANIGGGSTDTPSKICIANRLDALKCKYNSYVAPTKAVTEDNILKKLIDFTLVIESEHSYSNPVNAFVFNKITVNDAKDTTVAPMVGTYSVKNGESVRTVLGSDKYLSDYGSYDSSNSSYWIKHFYKRKNTITNSSSDWEEFDIRLYVGAGSSSHYFFSLNDELHALVVNKGIGHIYKVNDDYTLKELYMHTSMNNIGLCFCDNTTAYFGHNASAETLSSKTMVISFTYINGNAIFKEHIVRCIPTGCDKCTNFVVKYGYAIGICSQSGYNTDLSKIKLSIVKTKLYGDEIIYDKTIIQGDSYSSFCAVHGHPNFDYYKDRIIMKHEGGNNNTTTLRVVTDDGKVSNLLNGSTYFRLSESINLHFFNDKLLIAPYEYTSLLLWLLINNFNDYHYIAKPEFFTKNNFTLHSCILFES